MLLFTGRPFYESMYIAVESAASGTITEMIEF